MSGETEKSVSGWTTDTLKELVDAKLDALIADCKANQLVANERDVRYSQRFSAQQEALTAALSAAKEAVAAALLAADRAVSKAELASEKRFESVNEFRGALSDQTSKLLPRVEADQRFTTLEEKFNRLDKVNSERFGGDKSKDASSRTNLVLLAVGVSAFFSFLAITVTVISLVLRLTGH